MNPYSTNNNYLDLYPDLDLVHGVDLRVHLYNILYTNNEGTDVLYRRAILENGQPKKCPCVLNNRSFEPDRDIRCEHCDGLGYFFNDHPTRTYINNSQAYAIYKRVKKPGDSQVEYKTSYFEWNFLSRFYDTTSSEVIPNRFDRVIKLEQDLEGNTESPSKAREIYEILSIDPYRLDNNGRIEYYRFRVISVIDKSFLI